MSSIVCACGKPVEERADMAGQWIACPGCGATLYQPFPGDKPSVPTAAPTRLCGMCSETIPAADATCKYCGSKADGAAPAPVAPAPAAAPPSPATTSSDPGLPALIVSMLGYFFCGLACPIGWIMASNLEKKCRANGLEVTSMVKAAKVIGIIGSIFFVINMIYIVLWAVASCL